MANKEKKISIFVILTIALLITGNLVGAGILGLPIQAGIDGFFPSLIGMLIVAGAMYYTAIILGNEANLEKEPNFNYPSLYHNYLGLIGKWIAIAANLIILYGLLTAYLTGATTIITNLFHFHVPNFCIMLVFFLLITGLTVTNIHAVRRYNALLMILLGISFAVIVLMSEKYVEVKRYSYTCWDLLPAAIPIIVTSFHFHNIIPTVCKNLEWNSSTIWKTMLLGMFIGYAMNAIWIQVGIGALPLKDSAVSIVTAYEKSIPATVPLAKVMQSSVFTAFSLLFALLAISTSYLANSRGLMGFFDDLTINHFKIRSRLLTLTLSFGPPLIIALIYPGIFLKALDVVGGVGIVVLFGILPSIIAIMRSRSAGGRGLGMFMLILFLAFLAFTVGKLLGFIKIDLGPLEVR